MKDLTVGKEGKLIFQFAMPMVVGNILQQLFSIADTIIVGKFIGKEALAGVGASFPIIYTLIAFVIGTSQCGDQAGDITLAGGGVCVSDSSQLA